MHDQRVIREFFCHGSRYGFGYLSEVWDAAVVGAGGLPPRVSPPSPRLPPLSLAEMPGLVQPPMLIPKPRGTVAQVPSPHGQVLPTAGSLVVLVHLSRLPR